MDWKEEEMDLSNFALTKQNYLLRYPVKKLLKIFFLLINETNNFAE